MSLADLIMGVESGGDPNAKNPNSSASGAGQFIDSTWLSMLRQHRPDITGSDADLLALKSDPNLSRQMTDAYASDNAAILTKAGHEATPGNTYLAHFAGPQGAVSVLSADPNTPISSVLTPGAIAANPFLKGMTAGDLKAWADRKMGGAPQAVAPTNRVASAIMGQPASATPQAAQNPTDLASLLMGQQQVAPQMQGDAPMPLPNILGPPRRQVDLSKLKAAFSPVSTGFFSGRG